MFEKRISNLSPTGITSLRSILWEKLLWLIPGPGNGNIMRKMPQSIDYSILLISSKNYLTAITFLLYLPKETDSSTIDFFKYYRNSGQREFDSSHHEADENDADYYHRLVNERGQNQHHNPLSHTDTRRCEDGKKAD